MQTLFTLLVLGQLGFVASQAPLNNTLPNTFPHAYPGLPNDNANFSDAQAWQNYFIVNDLKNVSFTLPRHFAGNIPVNRQGHPNNTLFFWGFEKSNGSLTRSVTDNDSDPWGIWLNGGPGSSSLVGLFYENGPLHLSPTNGTLIGNEFAWNTLLDMFWIDQPVGTGFSTADDKGYINSEDQMGEDFMGFLTNLVQVFPSLKTRPFYLMGESYAGTYIPYIVKTYFSLSDPPVNLKKFAIGDGSLGSDALVENVPMLSVIETYPQLIDYNTDVYNYFKEQTHLCGYDLNITYPQNGHFPTLRVPFEGDNLVRKELSAALHSPRSKSTLASLTTLANFPDDSINRRDLSTRMRRLGESKRDLTGRANGTIDPFYQCDLLIELISYTINFTKPWAGVGNIETLDGFDIYDIPNVVVPSPPNNGDLSLGDGVSAFMNDASVRSALHAPTSKDWLASFHPYPFENNASNFLKPDTNENGDPSLPPTSFLSELATNSSNKNIGWVLYSGNDDMIVAHHSTELAIQNTTFGGIQGFSQPPSTPWFGDDGQIAGVVHQERNVTFVLFKDAGHLIPQWQPSRAVTFIKEFVLGSNKNGTLNADGSLVGGNSSSLPGGILPELSAPIFTGSGTTAGSTLWPSATVAAWESFIKTAIPTAPAPGGNGNGHGNAANRITLGDHVIVIGVAILVALII